MEYFSQQAREHDLPFRSDGDAINLLDEQGAALACLHDAVSRCQHEDMRTRPVLAALEFLRASLPAGRGADTAIHNFRQALALPHPHQRQEQLQHAYRSIELAGD
ncbi:MAG: Uncharacterised protein [Opitutia bacterium UBA7350]|nr:MAG: Uncharacterised protein [Opitutae bacterium UBA7350]